MKLYGPSIDDIWFSEFSELIIFFYFKTPELAAGQENPKTLYSIHLICAILLHIVSYRTVQYLLSYIRFTMPAKPEPAPAIKFAHFEKENHAAP